MMLLARCAALLVIACAFAAAPATADPLDGQIGITLNPILGGVHDSYNDQIHLPPIPVPLLEGNLRYSLFELTAYGLPPTIPIPYTDAIQGSVALRLSILNATLRVWDPSGRFAIGAGELVYNQTTSYARADGYALTGTGGQTQYSRIAGAHYQAATRIPVHADRLEIYLDYAPVLLGTQVSTYTDGSPTLFNPERGQQIETNVQFTHHVGRHTDMVFGVRYVNFTAAYDIPSRPLSDRNAAVLPSFGYLWRL
jgi:hypothetical protein